MVIDRFGDLSSSTLTPDADMHNPMEFAGAPTTHHALRGSVRVLLVAIWASAVAACCLFPVSYEIVVLLEYPVLLPRRPFVLGVMSDPDFGGVDVKNLAIEVVTVTLVVGAGAAILRILQRSSK